MRLPRQKSKKKHRRALPDDDPSLEAITTAESHLEEVQSRADEVREIATTAKNIRTRNHFGEQLQTMLSGPHSHRKRPT